MPSFEYIARLKEENMKKSLATRKKEHLDMEFDKTNSVMFNNVAVIENIQGEALDFTK